MLSPAIRRLIQAGLAIGAFSLCFGIVVGARAQNVEAGEPLAALLRSHSVCAK